MKWWRRKFLRNAGESVDREIAYHLAESIAAKIAAGFPDREARRLALVEFGGVDQARQQVREVYTSALLETARANLRAAFRFIHRSPAFALAVILIFALGLGANSAVFSAIDGILLRPLPFPHADELVRIHQAQRGDRQPEYFVAPARVEDWNRMNSTFQAISGYYTGDATLMGGTFPEKITVAFVAPRFLTVWGVSPKLGRDFTEEEQHFGGPNAIIVTDRFFRIHLKADLSAIGRPIKLGQTAYSVVGVMPESFRFPDREVDGFIPNQVDAPYSQSRDSTWFTAIGRMKERTRLATAQADLTAVQVRLGQQFPQSDSKVLIELEPLKHEILDGVGKSLWLFYGSVSLLLLIACMNIAALFMARVAARQHEFAIRFSLGATRRTIVVQLLSEILVLALIGSIAGLALADEAVRLFIYFAKGIPRADEVTLNWHVVLYSLGCALATTLLTGLIPALRGTQDKLSGSMSLGSRTQVSGRNRAQWLFVGVQVALAVTLLIASGLLLRSFQALGRVDPGFEAAHVLTLRISAGWGETSDMGTLVSRINRTLDAVRNIPGVEAAATASTVPGNSTAYPAEFRISETLKNSNDKLLADTRWVSTGYFAALHIPVLQGTACTDRAPDSRKGSAYNSVVVNRSFAERYFSGTSVIGYHLQAGASSVGMNPGEILGVVGDAREEGVETSARPTVYWCFSAPVPDPYFLVRVHGETSSMMETLRKTIHTLEPGRSVFGVATLEEHLGERQAENRLRTFLLTLFAGTAITLVSIGLYGTISYLGLTRRREVGLRLALGALPHQLVSRFMGQGLRVAALGGLAGMILGSLMTGLLKGMLYGVTALDPLTYVAVFGLTLSVALAACFIPSLRAVQVNPTEMLREE